MPQTKKTTEQNRANYLRWKATRDENFIKNQPKCRWNHICVVFRNILIDDSGYPSRKGGNMRNRPEK